MMEFLSLLWVQRIAFVLAGLLLGFLGESALLGRIRKPTESTRIKWDDLILRSLRGLRGGFTRSVKRLQSRYASEGIEIPFPTQTVINKGAHRA